MSERTLSQIAEDMARVTRKSGSWPPDWHHDADELLIEALEIIGLRITAPTADERAAIFQIVKAWENVLKGYEREDE